MAWVRIAPSAAEHWHVDPASVTPPKTRNFALLVPGSKHEAPEFPMDANALASAFDAMILTNRRASRLAGGPEDLWATYVVRTRYLRFPDYVSVKFLDLGNGNSTLAIFSRARFGFGDGGLNRARVKAWMKRLAG